MKQQPLISYYELQMALVRLERRSREVKEARKQAMFHLRDCNEKLLNYEGGIRCIFDKLSGKQEEKLEVLNREIRNAEAARNALIREQEALEQNRKDMTAALEQFPPVEELRETDELLWAELERKLCREILRPLLERNREALLEYRSLLRGERPEILSVQQQQEIYSEPDVWAEKCVPLLQRLKTAMDIQNIPFEICSYYQSPKSYLVYAAAKHNRLDRVNQALDQVEKTLKTVQNI